MVQSTSISSIVIAGAVATAITMTAAFAQSTTGAQSPPANPAGSTQRASSQTAPNGEQPENPAAQNFLIEHEIGHRFHFDPSSLPPPKTGPIVTDRSLIVPYSGQRLEVPPGFSAAPFATGLANPRRLLVLANGDVLVAESRISTSLMGSPGRATICWSPTRTASGRCRMSRGRCAPAARYRHSEPTNCPPISASRSPAPTVLN
jgi:glucose/arabinose dehydrogenase